MKDFKIPVSLLLPVVIAAILLLILLGWRIKEINFGGIVVGPPPGQTQVPTLSPACQAILGVLPGNPQGIRAKFQIPEEKGIRVFNEICPEAPNGFIVDTSPISITLTVPVGGCIDSDSGAHFTGPTVPEKTGGGLRATSGTVTAKSLTYRIAGCELKP